MRTDLYRARFVLTIAAVLASTTITSSVVYGQQAPPADADTDTESDTDPTKDADADPAGSTPARFSLDKLIERAVDNEDLVAEFQAKRAKAKWDRYKADHITWMPSLRSTTFLAVVPDNADPDEFERNLEQIGNLDIGPYVREDFDVILPMFTFGKEDAAQKLAKVGLDNNSLALEKARLKAIYQTKRAYWGMRLAAAFREMLDRGDRLIGGQLDSMQQERDFGGADFEIEDFRKLEIFNAEVDSRQIDNQKLGSVARAGLHFLADIPQNTPIEVAKLDDLASPPTLGPATYYIDQAQKYRPELRQLNKAVRARSLQAKLARAGWYPDIFAALRIGFGWSTKDTAFQRVCTADSADDAIGCDFDGDQASIGGQQLYAEPYGDPLHSFSVRLGVGLRWNVDPFQQYGEVQKKKAQARVVRSQRRRARGAVGLEIRKLHRDASDALEKIDVNHRRLKAAQRWRDQFGLSKQTAGADVADAVEPLKAFYESRALYLQAIFDYRVARAALARAVGARRLDDDGRAVRPRP